MEVVSNALLFIVTVFPAIPLLHALIAVLPTSLILDHVLNVLQVALLAATLLLVLTVSWDSSSMEFNVIVALLVVLSVPLSQTALFVFKATFLTHLIHVFHVNLLFQVVSSVLLLQFVFPVISLQATSLTHLLLVYFVPLPLVTVFVALTLQLVMFVRLPSPSTPLLNVSRA